MNIGKRIISGFTIILICCLLALSTLIAIPIYLPQIQPGGELLVSISVLIISLGMFGYIIIIKKISILSRNITDVAEYLINIDVQSISNSNKEESNNLKQTNIISKIKDTYPEKSEPLPTTSNYSVNLNSLEGAIPGEALINRNLNPIQETRQTFKSNILGSAIQKTDITLTAIEYSKNRVGPCIDWISSGVFTLPQKFLTHSFLDLLTIKEGGKKLLLSNLRIANVSELHIFQQSLLYAVKKINICLNSSSGDLILPINQILCQDQVFLQSLILILQNNINQTNVINNNNIFHRLRIALPQKYFESEQIHQSVTPLFNLSAYGLKFAVLGEETKPVNVTKYIALNANLFIANSSLKYFNPTTATGLESFGSLADLLRAHSIEALVYNINSPALLKNYMNFPVSFVSGPMLSGVRAFSVLPDKIKK